jgi:hypothetical protein
VALATFEECYENSLAHYDSGEEAMAATTFGISKSKADFIEPSCHGLNLVTVHSDRLCYSSSMAKIFSSKHSLRIEGDKAMGVTVIRDYFELDREAFEAKYSGFLSR